MIEAVYSSPREKYLSNNYDMSSCYLILNDEVLYVVDKNEDMLLRAFYISEIDIKMTRNGTVSNHPEIDPFAGSTQNDTSSLLCITLNQPRIDPNGIVRQQSGVEGHYSAEYNQLYENTMDRLVDYVLHLNGSKDDPARNDLNDEDEVLFDYYKLRRTSRNFQTMPNLIVCLCGSKIISLKSINKLTIAESFNEAMKPLDTSSGVVSTIENTMSAVSRQHTRQSSNLSDIAKIHRTISNNTENPDSHASQANNTHAINNAHLNGNKANKKLFYYVDPRLSENFINIFNSLKRRASNKGFHF